MYDGKTAFVRVARRVASPESLAYFLGFGLFEGGLEGEDEGVVD